MEIYIARPLLLRILIGCLVAAIAAAQPPQLKVFRGTLVHSRVRTEIEMLEDYLIGFNESNYGTVSCYIYRILYAFRGIAVFVSGVLAGLLSV